MAQLPMGSAVDSLRLGVGRAAGKGGSLPSDRWLLSKKAGPDPVRDAGAWAGWEGGKDV